MHQLDLLIQQQHSARWAKLLPVAQRAEVGPVLGEPSLQTWLAWSKLRLSPQLGPVQAKKPAPKRMFA